jgi:hypothetical protein
LAMRLSTLSTDQGVEMASLAIQVFGGVGFIEETGAAQHYRDIRIAPIYRRAASCRRPAHAFSSGVNRNWLARSASVRVAYNLG